MLTSLLVIGEEGQDKLLNLLCNMDDYLILCYR